MLSQLSPDSHDNVASIASANGIRPLVQFLSLGVGVAQAHAAGVLSDMAASSAEYREMILAPGVNAIPALVSLLTKVELS